eukprot:1578858-Prymnesium_polylepis.1
MARRKLASTTEVPIGSAASGFASMPPSVVLHRERRVDFHVPAPSSGALAAANASAPLGRGRRAWRQSQSAVRLSSLSYDNDWTTHRRLDKDI